MERGRCARACAIGSDGRRQSSRLSRLFAGAGVCRIFADVCKPPGGSGFIQKALAWEQAAYGPVSDGYFKNLENYAELYLSVNRPDGAERLYRDCAETAQRVGGPDAVNVASCLVRLGNVLREYGRYSEAIPIYRRVIAIYEKGLSPDHPWTLTAQSYVATLD